MDRKTVTISLGCGLTSALIVGAIVSSVLEDTIAFSVFIGIPAGIFVGTVIGLAAYYRLKHHRQDHLAHALAGVAIFGYVIVLAHTIRVFVPAVRQQLTFDISIATAVVLAIVVFAMLELYHR